MATQKFITDSSAGICVDTPMTGAVVPNINAVSLSSADVRGILNHLSASYPEASKALDAASRLIIHLETLRREAILSISLGRTEDARRLLKLAAVVEVNHD